MNPVAARRILGLGEGSKPHQDEIKAAYRAAARRWHPDVHPEASKAAAEHEFKQARAAFDVLQAPYRAAARQARAGPAWKLGGGVPLGVNLGSRFFIMFCLLCAAERERWQQNARRASGAR